MLRGGIRVGYDFFGSYLIPQVSIREWFLSLCVIMMLSRLWFSCMGSWYIVCMVMHDVVVVLYYYMDMFMIKHVHANVD